MQAPALDYQMQDSTDSKNAEPVPSNGKSAVGSIAGCKAGSASPVTGFSVGSPGSAIDFSDKRHTDKVLKELPMSEFLSVLESSSAEELELMLRNASQVERKPQTELALQPLVARFFGLEAPRRGNDVLSTFFWWESRRIQYNLVVGACGIASLLVLQAVGFLTISFGVVVAAIGYGIMANACYCTGGVSDFLARHFWKEKADHFGAILYCQGLALSMFLTLIPAAVAISITVLGRF
jgi:hypothetical protein